MVATCHLCGRELVGSGDGTDGTGGWFACADCGKPTCEGCKSIGVGRESDHCRRCRG